MNRRPRFCFHMMLTDAPGEAAYPIMATVFVLMHKSAAPGRARDVLGFFSWALERGAQDASALGYIPLPQSLIRQIRCYWVEAGGFDGASLGQSDRTRCNLGLRCLRLGEIDGRGV